jgi:hypothetical protein
MRFNKVAYWLKSGPFLVGNQSRLIWGQARNLSCRFRGKKFLQFLTIIANAGISNFKQIYGFL